VNRAGAGVVPSRSAAQAAREIADLLERRGYSYAIGGALALAVAGVPRGTADVDVNVFVAEDDVGDLARVLEELGIELDVEAAIHRARRDGMFVGTWEGMRIDVFVPSIPFSREAEKTRVRIATSDGWAGWFLSPEAITVFKLMFYRGKDMVDLERLVAVRGGDLDHVYVRRWIVEMMGDDDDRVRRWDELVGRFGGG
jgi:hypothetical protein